MNKKIVGLILVVLGIGLTALSIPGHLFGPRSYHRDWGCADHSSVRSAPFAPFEERAWHEGNNPPHHHVWQSGMGYDEERYERFEERWQQDERGGGWDDNQERHHEFERSDHRKRSPFGPLLFFLLIGNLLRFVLISGLIGVIVWFALRKRGHRGGPHGPHGPRRGDTPPPPNPEQSPYTGDTQML